MNPGKIHEDIQNGYTASDSELLEALDFYNQLIKMLKLMGPTFKPTADEIRRTRNLVREYVDVRGLSSDKPRIIKCDGISTDENSNDIKPMRYWADG